MRPGTLLTSARFLPPLSASVLALALTATGCTTTQRCADGCLVEGDSETGSLTHDLDGWTPLLQSFDLAFTDGDRPPAVIAVGAVPPDGPTGPQFHLQLVDGDGNDPMRGSARYVRWSQATRVFFGLPEDSDYGVQRFVSQSGCRRSCDLAIPGFDSSENVLILAGFRFRYPEGENNLREIGLWPHGVEPLGPRTFVRATLRDDDGAEPFDVEVSYVLFPTSWSNRGVAAGTAFGRPAPGPSLEVPLNPVWLGRIPLLGGFQLDYAESDEHLREIGVDANDRRIIMTLRDNDAAEQINVGAIYRGFCEAPLDENVHIMACP